MADTPRPMNISDACTEIFRLEGMVRELRAERARGKEALPVAAYRYEFTGVYPTPIETLFVDACDRWEIANGWKETALTDHAAATAALSELRAEVARYKADFNTAPRRAVRLTLVLDADSYGDLEDELFNISARAGRGEMTEGVSGGPNAGYIYELLSDPAMTHAEYFKRVHAYLDAKRPATPNTTEGA